MKHIKKFLTKNNCKLKVIELHNHWLNATKHAIQIFKATFIVALATTDRDFHLHLWDRLTPQVDGIFNMLRALQIDSTFLAYEILHSPYDWDQYLLALIGCKAVVYEDGDTHGSWAWRDVDAFYLGLAKDHYRCKNYYIPETRVYCISGWTELLPKHC